MAEFVVFFLLAPVVMAVVVPPRWMFPVLGVVTIVGLALLSRTPGFRWRELVHGSGRIGWGFVFAVVAATGAIGAAVMVLTVPEPYWLMIRRNPVLMLMIALFYPVISALPQEIVFRPLFFRRYGAILPASSAAIGLNAAVFSLAHLMYWSWIVAGMTFAGGLVFAYSYRVRGNFPEAVVAHSLAGLVIFALGLGVFFYSGNVTRPF